MTINIPPGRTGDLTMAGFDLGLEEWTLSLNVENEDYKHFNMEADDNGIRFKGVLKGFGGGQGTCRGKFDNTAGSFLPTNKSAYIDQHGTGFLGYTSTVGWIVTYELVDLDTAQSTQTPLGAIFGFQFKVTACRFTSTGS